jgi:hypothetical protein
MAYFPDLSPYAYGSYSHPGVVHIGWLDNIHPFPKGKVSDHLLEKMRKLAKKPTELYRGVHVCELCCTPAGLYPAPKDWTDEHRLAWWEWSKPRSSNGEIRITAGSVTFAAPVLITHYIKEHGYLPPPEFLKALEEAPS